MNLTLPPLGLYVHIPWCVRKCPYCDFNSHAAGDVLPEESYVKALLCDLDADLELVRGRRLESVFFGGGTPSLFSPYAIRHLIESIRTRIDCSQNLEVTLEANPGTVEKDKFRAFREAGVNRLSIGVQSFQAARLNALGRIHTGAEAVQAAEEAHRAGIVNFNLDLMYGLPGQNTKEAVEDVRKAIALKPAQISYYQLTIEAGTPFSKDPPRLPADDEIWEMQCVNQSLLLEHGYEQYETSAYARPGFQCLHNLNYWKFGDYLGIGAGAHAKITDVDANRILRRAKVRNPGRYLKTAGTPECIESSTEIPKNERGLEFLMNALRLNAGFEKSRFISRTGLPLSVLEPTLNDCLEEKLLEQSETEIRCTPRGRNFLDEILARFVQG
ncbi:MAG: radical SAM family heme chaperone HemW [Gammaproteobacteria bacterium]